MADLFQLRTEAAFRRMPRMRTECWKYDGDSSDYDYRAYFVKGWRMILVMRSTSAVRGLIS